jgi:hypothetical protein
MRRAVKAMVAAAVACCLPVVLGAEDFEWTGQIAKGKSIEIKTISGEISAEFAKGDKVEVVGHKRGWDRYHDEVDFEVVTHRGGVTICAIYIDDRGRATDCEPEEWSGRSDRRRHHHHGHHDIDVDVDFEIRVPAGVDFVGRVVSGDVEAEDLRSHITARSVSGDVDISTSESADAATVSGTLRVAMGRADWKGDLDFSTVSGDIILTFPRSLSTELEFSSLSGELDSDFPVSISSRRERFVGQRLRGTIGRGGRTLHLKTVSGDVELRQGS